MIKPINPEFTDDVNPEWTEDMFASAVRVDALSTSLQAKLKRGGRPISENPKVATTVRLDADVLLAFKATGKGWQTRMNAALRDYVQSHSMQ
jgi:uncharacterized protein (DUF4415 family)